MKPSELTFLPDYPFEFGNVVLIALLLIAGLVVGELFRRVLLVPRISGYVVTGLLLGPGTLGLIDSAMLDDARLLFDIALGLILFELGSRLDLQWLRKNPWLTASSLAEIGFSFGLVLLVLVLFGIPLLQAALGAAIGTATGAPVLLLMIHLQRADGPLTERAINHTGLNNVFAVVAVTMLLSLVHLEYRAAGYLVLLHPLYLLFGSALLGFLASIILVRLARWLGKREDLQFILLVAMVLFTLGVSMALELSMLISLLALGVMARNRDVGRDLLPVEFGPTAQALFVILFVLTGAEIALADVAAALWLGLAYAVARVAGKVLGVMSFAQLSGLRLQKSALLGMTLMPMSAVAIVMARTTAEFYPEFGAELGAAVLAAVLIMDLAAPSVIQLALRAAGEAHPDARWS